MRYFIILFVLCQLGLKSQTLYFPPLSGNNWDTLSPASVGYCQPRIDSLYNYLQLKNSKAFIILKDGKIVLEKYFGTYTQDSLWYWASAGKSLAGFITGIAQEKGFININNAVSQYIGTNWTSAPLQKENLITVRNLLTMTSGLDDVPPTPCTNEDTAKACLIYKADAGTRWAYHSGAYRKVQDVVSQATSLNYNTVTNNWIKTKTGMSGIWYNQIYHSKARDMARFGLLILNKGIWNTDTLLKDTTYFNTMLNSSQNLNKAYGYLWWLNGKSSFMVPTSQITFPGTLIPNAPSDMFCALGKNDQKIYIVPSQNMVIIRQGNTAGGFNLALSAFDNTLWSYINQLGCVTSTKKNQELFYHIYPNPVKSSVILDNQKQTIQNIKVYTIYGQAILAPQHISDESSVQIDLSGLSAGVYVIEIVDHQNIVVRQRIIKE